MNKKIITLVLFLSILGIFFSGYLLKQHLKNIATGFEEKSFCNINEVINCDLVDMSSYSTIKDIPVSGLSLFFYINMVLALFLSLFRNRREPLFYAFLLSLVGTAFSLRMAFISFYSLRLVCLFCVGLYVVSLVSTLLLPVAMGGYKNLKDIFAEYFSKKITQSFIPQIIISAVIMLIGIGALNTQVKAAEHEWAHKKKMEQSKKNPLAKDLSIDELVKLFFEQPAVDIKLSGNAVKGNPNAKVVIVEFSDFECPFCKRAAMTFHQVVEEYKDEIAFYYINYPLDKSCNKYMQRELHKNACVAAVAAACAKEQGKFWPYHDTLFENQPKYAVPELKSYAAKNNLDTSQFNSCLQNQSSLSSIQTDIELAQKTQIQGTPSVFINGRKLNGWNNPELLKAVLDKAIADNK